MNKKYIVLIAMLTLPPLVFIFLKVFGQNHFELPVYYENGLQSLPTDSPDKQHYIPKFSFTNQEGKATGTREVKGHVYVANFIFTRCGSICPQMSRQFQRVQDHFEDNKELKLLSFSVDPTYDTVPVLAAYAQEFEVKPGMWHLLTGSKAEINTLAVRGFALPVAEVAQADPANAFIHSEKAVLVDTQGRIRGYYDATDPKEVDRLIAEIQILLDAPESEKKDDQKQS